MLNLTHVYKTYRPKRGKDAEALKDVNLAIAEKGLVFLLGKSGSGKSTLMNLIGGLDTPDQGEIQFFGKNIVSLSKEDCDAYRNTIVGFVFQEFNLIESFSVYKNIVLSMELQGKEATREDVVRLLESLELVSEIDRMPYELSGGQKQRVSIARALIKKPKIILADEPTGSLDSETGMQIFEVLKMLSKEHLVIVVSHDRDYAETYGDRIIELADGRVIKDTDPNIVLLDDQPFELTKSKLPFKDAFVLGFTAFVRKPVRMLFTLLLLIFAFSLFGILDSSANYHTNDVVIKNLYDRDASTLVISRTTYDELNGYDRFALFSQIHLDDLQADYPEYYMKEVFLARKNFDTVYNPQYGYIYYARTLSGFVEIDQEFLDSTGYSLVGRLPAAEDEVVIPMHIYENYQTFGYDDSGKVVINSPQDLLERYLHSDQEYTIVGILDTEFSIDRYQRVLDEHTDEAITRTLNRELMMINDGSVHTYLYVCPGVVSRQIEESNPLELFYDYAYVDTYDGTRASLYDMNESDHRLFHGNVIEKAVEFPEGVVFKADYDGTSLGEHQIILPMSKIEMDTAEEFMNDFDDRAFSHRDELVDAFAEAHFDEISIQLMNDYGITTWQEYASLIRYSRNVVYFEQTYDYDDFLLRAKVELAMDIYWNFDDYFTLNLQKNHSGMYSTTSYFDVDIVGYYPGTHFMVNASFFDEILQETSNYPWRQVIVALSGDQQDDLDFLYELNERVDRFEANNEITHMMSYVNDPIVFFADILIWVALGLGVFSGMLFYNFMSVSIHHKKKEVGILRSLGARRSDVFMIFFSEAVIISLIVFIASFFTSYVIVTIGDTYVVNHFGLEVSILWVGVRQLITLFILTTSVAILSSWIPINRFAKQKPIDTIKIV
jgi:ABC-type lipoprotein export system ATPase subunit